MRINNSEDCAKSELDLFSVPPTQTVVEEGVWDTIQPHPNFEKSSVITFDIPGTNIHYIDLSQTELHIKCKLNKKLESEIKNDVEYPKDVYIINNVLHSLFQQIQISLNNAPVENTNRNYAYRAYLENLLCYNKESKQTFLTNCGWEKDVAGVVSEKDGKIKKTGLDEGIGPITFVKTSAEGISKSAEGMITRTLPFCNSKVVEYIGQLHCDTANINRYLLNNVNVNVTLTRSKPEFLFCGTACSGYDMVIEECLLKIRRVNISQSVMLAHAMALEKTTAKYPIKRVEVKNIQVPVNSPKFAIQNLARGVMPTRVVVGLVDNVAFAGSFDKNPFNFHHYKMKELTLKVSSRALPYSTALTFDFENNQYREGYQTLFKNIKESPNDILYEDFKNGYALFAFDLTPDLCSSDHYSLLKDGQLDLDITIGEFSTNALILIAYMEYDNIIEITKDRNILYDYKV
jgi:hypothetical protein